MKPKVSVIIPTKNEEKNIDRCLKTLKKLAFGDLEIIVVDNSSTDQTVQIAQKLGARVFQIGPERSAQRNFGAQKARGNLLFFLDADMEVEKKLIPEAVSLFQKDPDLAALVVPEKSAGNDFWARTRALERNCYLGEPTIEAARIFDKRAFSKIGGFDKNLIAAEDWDLTQRVTKSGKIGRTKSKIIHHEEQLSLLAHLKKKYYYSKNIRRYAQKYPEKFKDQSGFARLLIFAKNWKILATDPMHGIGVIVLKSLEYIAFLLAK